MFRLLITIADEVLLQICFPFLQKADGPMHFTASSAPISIATEENALKSDTDPKIFAEVSVKMHSLHSEGLNEQSITISIVSSKLLFHLQPNLVW